MSAIARTVVVGMGNPVLGDDGVGLRIAAGVSERLAGRSDVAVKQLCAGGLRLVEAIAGYDRAIVIDAIVSGRRPGVIRELGPADLPATRTVHSSHEGSLPAALAVGRMAGLGVPDEILICAVEAADVETFGEALTPAVERAVPRAIGRVLARLGRPRRRRTSRRGE